MIGLNERFEMRLDPETLAKLDMWRAKEPGLPSRSEAVRRLVSAGLEKPRLKLEPHEKLSALMLSAIGKKLGADFDFEFVERSICYGEIWAIEREFGETIFGKDQSDEDVKFVDDVLYAYWTVHPSLGKLSEGDKEWLKENGLSLSKAVFCGFDGNHEANFFVILNTFFDYLKRYNSIDPKERNSHCPMVDTYRGVVSRHKKLMLEKRGSDRFSKEDILFVFND